MCFEAPPFPTAAKTAFEVSRYKADGSFGERGFEGMRRLRGEDWHRMATAAGDSGIVHRMIIFPVAKTSTFRHLRVSTTWFPYCSCVATISACGFRSTRACTNKNTFARDTQSSR